MPVPESVLTLISNFERNYERYVKGHYNETQVRRDFIDPLFTALGWDMDNKSGYAEEYRDVIHEDAIKIGSSMRAPDYSFRVGGTRKFFVEAKKPSVKIKDDPDAAFQLRRYGWSAKLPLSILTDFEEFAVYDCRIKPDKADKASTAAQCRFEWNLTGRIFPGQVRCSLASCHSSGVFGAVKGGRSPAQRTLDGIEKALTLKGLGLDAGFASCPRARPAARTSPPSGRG
ncbi:type I restriction endonuclease [Massilia sp. PWRC2]|uniref:type I restriction endonuclease n=1 Tax=Massilia sp. PWRC2 TaxID=2804626 RepID=UPI003CF5C216